MTIKDVVETIESLVTTLALIVGGIWTYILFVKHRQKFPKANLTTEVFQVSISDKKTLVHVIVTISNIGEVLLKLNNWEIRLLQILPLWEPLLSKIKSEDDLVKEGETEIEWPLIGLREFNRKKVNIELEPGEKEQLHSDFIIDSALQLVQIYTFIQNNSKSGPIGWPQTIFFHISSKELGTNSSKKKEAKMSDSKKSIPAQQQPKPRPSPPEKSNPVKQMPPKARPPK